MRTWTVSIAACAAAVLAGAVPATVLADDIDFADQKNYAFPDGAGNDPCCAPSSIAAGDYNGDGHADIVVSTSDGKYVGTYEGRGDGTFDYGVISTPVTPGDGTYPETVAIARVIGHADLLIGFSGPNQIASNGHYSDQPYAYDLAAEPFAMNQGDLNNDGLTDFVLANPSASSVSVVLQTSEGLTTARPGSSDANVVPAPAAAYGALPIDPVIDDVAVARRATPRGSSPCTNLPVPTSHNVTAPAPTRVAVGDIDRDGNADLYVSADYGSGGTSDWIAYGDGNGCFPDAATAPGDSRYAVLHDMNGDGDLELLASPYGCTGAATSPPDTCNTAIQVFDPVTVDGRLNYDIEFSISAYANNVDYPQQWTVADFNGDGHPDIFAAGYRHVTVGTSGFGSIILNQQVGSSWGNWGKDNQVIFDSDAADGPAGAVQADFNEDGYPDVATMNVTSKTISVALNETASNAVVASTSATVQTPGATARAASAAATAGERASRRVVPLRLRCKPGIGRRCRGVLTVRHLAAGGEKGAPPRATRRLARLRYRLTPGGHTVRVPVGRRLGRELRGDGRKVKVHVGTRTRQSGGRRPARHAAVVEVRR